MQALTYHFTRDPAACSDLVRFSIGGIGQIVSGQEGERRQRQFQLVANASLHLRGHTLGLGADYRRMVGIRRDPTGSLTVFADDLTAVVNSKNLWENVAAPVNTSADIHELSLWIQDTWQVTSRLTVAAGLRWEYSPPPAPVDGIRFLNPQTNTVYTNQAPQQELTLWPLTHRNFAPRLGLALRLTRDGKTILRTGGGLYFDSSLSIATDSPEWRRPCALTASPARDAAGSSTST